MERSGGTLLGEAMRSLNQFYSRETLPRLRGYKTFFHAQHKNKIAEHEIFSADKYENANNRQTIGFIDKLLVFRWELTVLLLLQICFFFVMRDMKSLSQENRADIIEAFNSTSRYLDDLLNIDNIYFDQMVDRIYPTELQLNRPNSSYTEAPVLDF